MKKRLLSLALALVMALALLPTAALASSRDYLLLFEDEDCRADYYTWDHTTGTLTLRNYDGYGCATDLDFYYTLPSRSVIVELMAGSCNYIRKGDLQAETITVRGSGTLVIGENATLNCQTLRMEGGALIVPRLSADSITVNGGSLSLTGDSNDDYYPLSAKKLTLRNCTLTLTGTGHDTFGVYDELTLDNLRFYRATDPTVPNSVCKIVARGEGNITNMADRIREKGRYYEGELDGQWVTFEGDAGVVDQLNKMGIEYVKYTEYYLIPIGVPTAYPSTQKVDVDGKAVEFQCYALKDAAGNDTNYIKLRDLADILNNSAAQFQVGWDNQVTITTGEGYTKNGTEQHTPFSGQREYKLSAAQTLVDGAAKPLAAFTLTDDAGGGYTYYKLRDLGAALGFKVDWSAEKGIFIETK